MKKNLIKPKLIILATLLAYACSEKPTVFKNKYGEYIYHITNNSQGGLPVISGTIYDYETKEPLKTTGAIKVDDAVKCETDVNGNFLFTVKPGKYQFTGAGFPYEFCETKAISTRLGDSVKLYIYLKPNTKTLN